MSKTHIHRVDVHFGDCDPAGIVFFPNFSRNLQSGELESTSAKMQKATIRVYQERHYRSRLILPVVQH